MKTVDGRVAITRKEWAEQIERSEAEARRLYGQRDTNGHPAPAFSIGRTAYWWKDELDAWWAKREVEIRPKPIKRVGDPDELLYAQGVADLLGYTNPRAVLSMHQRDQFAQPDAIAPAGKGGDPRPQWKRATVWDWADNRKRVRPQSIDNRRQPD